MDLQTLELKRNKIVFDADALLKLAERESRGLTDEETKRYDDLLEKQLPSVKTQIANVTRDAEQIDGLKRLEAGIGLTPAYGFVRAKSTGQQFIESAAWKWITETKAARAGAWRSPSVELKTTLTEDPASGGGLVVPQYLSGILPSPTRPVVMSDLFAKGPTTSNAIVYMEEKTFTNAAAPTLEGSAKPESGLTFAAITAKVSKVAHWLPVTDELLEDEPAMASYIDARLTLGVLLALDNQLLNGDGIAPNLLGLLVRNDLTAPLPKGTATAIDAIAAQIAAVEAASQLPVDGIVVNPADFLKMALSKTTTGEYLGTSPFQAPQAPTLFGRAVAQTVLMPAGTVLVGSFKSGGGQLFQRGGMRVEASNSHMDFFIKNLVAILAEIRVALALFRPTAYGLVTGV